MSLHLEFEPHSWYKEFAIKKTASHEDPSLANWYAYTDNGNTGYIVEFSDDTLRMLKRSITDYHKRNAERDAYNRRMIGEK